MKHKDKLKLARKLLTQKELKEKVPAFQSHNWEQRKEAIKNKVKNKMEKVIKNKVRRKKKKLKLIK